MSIIAGFLTGVTASMGLGGGFILVVYLSVFLGMGQLQAGGINLLFFLPIALIAVVLHIKNKLIELKSLPLIIITGVAFAVAGSLIANAIDENLLRKIFAGMLIIIGVREVLHKKT